jgi:hypothetical protein
LAALTTALAVDGATAWGWRGPPFALRSFMRITVAVAMLVCSCADRPGAGPADLAATDGSAPLTLACQQSLADYCAQHADVCGRDLTTAETSSSWCRDLGSASFATYSTCDGYVAVTANVVDSGTEYLYDAATGELVAVLWYANINGGCLAGPAEFTLQGCRGHTRICPRYWL